MPKKKESTEWVITRGRLSRWQKEQRRRRQIIVIASVLIAIVAGLVIYAVYDSTVNQYKQTVLKVEGPLGERSFDMNYYIDMLRINGVAMTRDYSERFSIAENTLKVMENGEVNRQIAEGLGFTVTDAEINERIAEQFAGSKPGTESAVNPATPTYEEIRSDFLAFLDRLNVPEKRYREAMSNQLLSEKIHEHVKRTEVTEEMEQVHVQGIIIDVAPASGTPTNSGTPVVNGTPTAGEKEADPDEIRAAIESRLEAGDDFAVLVDEYSADPDLKESGGDVGWFPRGILSPDLEDVVFGLEPGVLSAPIPVTSSEDNTRYWILRVTEKEASRPLEEPHLQQLQNQALNEWYQEQLNNFTIKDDYLDSSDIEWAINKAL
ncbi:MAG: peptidylprolyl isomerase [Dehalococcoidia bacterium]